MVSADMSSVAHRAASRNPSLAPRVSAWPFPVAKAYRLLKAIMNTAVDDGITRRNPCRVRGASQDRSPERPVLTLREVVGLAEVIGDRYEALILLAVFGSLRWGELAALRRRDIDQDAGVAKIERSLTELPGGATTSIRQSQLPVSAPSRYQRRSCRHLSTTWRVTPHPRQTTWCSPVRPGRRYVTTISEGGNGCPRSPPPVWSIFIFTI